MTLSSFDECEAALSEMRMLLDARPQLESPEGRRLLWLASEVKTFCVEHPLSRAGAIGSMRSKMLQIWSDIGKALSRWN